MKFGHWCLAMYNELKIIKLIQYESKHEGNHHRSEISICNLTKLISEGPASEMDVSRSSDCG